MIDGVEVEVQSPDWTAKRSSQIITCVFIVLFHGGGVQRDNNFFVLFMHKHLMIK